MEGAARPRGSDMSAGVKTKLRVPDLRFPEFAGEWAEKRLGGAIDISSGNTPSKQVEAFWGGEFPWITAADLKVHELRGAQKTLTQSQGGGG